VSYDAGDFADAAADFARMRDAAAQLGDRRQEGLALAQLGMAFYWDTFVPRLRRAPVEKKSSGFPACSARRVLEHSRRQRVCSGGEHAVARLAFYTFGIARGPRGSAVMQGFTDRLSAGFAAAEATDGYITRRVDRPLEFGPRFYVPATHAGAPQTLSMWTGLSAVYAFAYHGLHAEALRLRREWFIEPQWPTYTAWWVGDDHVPAWSEAAERLEYLHDHGPTPFAFSFKRAFDAAGAPVAVERTPAEQDRPAGAW
jgi:hypothetical protein